MLSDLDLDSIGCGWIGRQAHAHTNVSDHIILVVLEKSKIDRLLLDLWGYLFDFADRLLVLSAFNVQKEPPHPS